MNDELYMRRAIFLASRADLASVKANPRVGAVLVYRGGIIGEGYHEVSGSAHAEVHCLASVQPRHRHLLRESTMYVTLEPCAHEGRTGSCARRLIEAGIRKVTIGTLDPNPLVAGKGVAMLRAAGVEVQVGLLEAECREVARVFLVNQLAHRPYVLLKWAESGDGFLDAYRSSSDTPPLALSTPFTQFLTHRIRGNSHGIIVGAQTALMDCPKLNNRYWHRLPSPQPMLLASRTAPLLGETLPEGWLQYPYQPELRPFLEKIYEEQGITSLLVEGGGQLLSSFLREGTWDEVRREVAPEIAVQKGVPAPAMPSEAIAHRSLTLDNHPITYYYNPTSPFRYPL